MKKFHKLLYLVYALPLILLATYAYATTCSLKVWSSGNNVLYTDLNSNFSCINNALGGGLTDSNINASAGISYTKLNFPGVFPKAFASLGSTTCTGNSATACTIAQFSRVQSIYGSGTTGTYCVCLSWADASQTFAAIASAQSATANSQCRTDLSTCSFGSQSCTNASFLVHCEKPAGTIFDIPFGVVVFDQNNI